MWGKGFGVRPAVGQGRCRGSAVEVLGSVPDRDKIVVFSCLDVYHKSPDSGERQYKLIRRFRVQAIVAWESFNTCASALPRNTREANLLYQYSDRFHPLCTRIMERRIDLCCSEPDMTNHAPRPECCVAQIPRSGVERRRNK